MTALQFAIPVLHLIPATELNPFVDATMDEDLLVRQVRRKEFAAMPSG